MSTFSEKVFRSCVFLHPCVCDSSTKLTRRRDFIDGIATSRTLKRETGHGFIYV